MTAGSSVSSEGAVSLTICSKHRSTYVILTCHQSHQLLQFPDYELFHHKANQCFRTVHFLIFLTVVIQPKHEQILGVFLLTVGQDKRLTHLWRGVHFFEDCSH